MQEYTLEIGRHAVRVYSYNTVVLGSGAAGFSAADRLWQYGQRDVAIVTEGINDGTSRNAGSDKQTYYKLSLAGSAPDSVRDMAELLFSGEAVDGDHALCEAALSAQAFYRLVELGVPFPCNRYGEYVGYRTDHDPSGRATSAGPYTSKMMTECLQADVERKGIPIFSAMRAIRLLTHEGAIVGVLCLDLSKLDGGYVVFACRNLVFATGGPAGMYADTVYPRGHCGATGLAFEAGAKGKNLTEWQFGLASLKPRWNVSGTYMQVVPRFISTDMEGGDAREFLSETITDADRRNSLVFLKGYQWPFDARKTGDSSLIDLCVYRETCLKGRRVFLDYRENPAGGIDFSRLDAEAAEYLAHAGACFGRPIDRLVHMNAPAVSFYKEQGVDLERDMLEIAVCAQHNNGGLDVDAWWQTCVEGFFAVGEAAATHGVYRPGGSALNAGQVGALRASRYIANRRGGDGPDRVLLERCASQIADMLALAECRSNGQVDIDAVLAEVRRNMSVSGGPVRSREGIRAARLRAQDLLGNFASLATRTESAALPELFRIRDTLICQSTYLAAMEDYCAVHGLSRGSAIYTDARGDLPMDGLPERFRMRPDDGSRAAVAQVTAFTPEGCDVIWRPVRPVPEKPDLFENMWRDYRRTGGVD